MKKLLPLPGLVVTQRMMGTHRLWTRPSLHRRVCHRNSLDSGHITSTSLLSEENLIAALQYNRQSLHHSAVWLQSTHTHTHAHIRTHTHTDCISTCGTQRVGCKDSKNRLFSFLKADESCENNSGFEFSAIFMDKYHLLPLSAGVRQKWEQLSACSKVYVTNRMDMVQRNHRRNDKKQNRET